MPHVDAFAQEVSLGWSVVVLRKLSHFVPQGMCTDTKKLYSKK